ncbi:MAG: ATP-binding protein [Planctomycetaceae bacterium]|nr:ATP-binding protein [Planctomycetaceae bacterium]
MSDQHQFEKHIPSDTGEGLKVQEEIVVLMEQFQYSTRDVFAMRLSLEEGLTNAIRHGNKLSPDKTVYVLCDIDYQRLRVVIQDQGAGFDPQDVPDPTMEEFLERPTGRGLMLMEAYLDEIVYEDSGRRLIMVRQRNSELPKLDD